MVENTETAKTELKKKYKFLLNQSPTYIANAWLLEAIERKKTINFIQSKGLLVEFLKSRFFK